jgi:hypothetical protein
LQQNHGLGRPNPVPKAAEIADCDLSIRDDGKSTKEIFDSLLSGQRDRQAGNTDPVAKWWSYSPSSEYGHDEQHDDYLQKKGVREE